MIYLASAASEMGSERQLLTTDQAESTDCITNTPINLQEIRGRDIPPGIKGPFSKIVHLEAKLHRRHNPPPQKIETAPSPPLRLVHPLGHEPQLPQIHLQTHPQLVISLQARLPHQLQPPPISPLPRFPIIPLR